MIKCRSLYKDYLQGSSVHSVLKGLDFEVEAGEFVGIMGKSGSGKTTLLNLIGLLDKFTSGEYYLDNIAMQGLDNIKRAYFRNKLLGFIFQNFFLLPKLTVAQNILLPLQYSALDYDLAAAKMQAMLSKLDIESLEHQYPSQLSGGQQQRVAVCRALICNPKVILADEPTGALDLESSNQLLDLLCELNNKQGVTILMITHDAEIANYADRVLNLVDGKLVIG